MPRLPALLVLAALTAAANAPKARVRNVVLVHGAWADGSSWAKVIPILEKAGLHVVAVQNPLTSLDEDVAAVQRAIALEGGLVILVGHSYGGAVITEAGADPKVAGLVYVAAFAPDAGQGVLDLGKDLPPAPGGADIRPDKGGFLKMTSKGIIRARGVSAPRVATTSSRRGSRSTRRPIRHRRTSSRPGRTSPSSPRRDGNAPGLPAAARTRSPGRGAGQDVQTSPSDAFVPRVHRPPQPPNHLPQTAKPHRG